MTWLVVYDIEDDRVRTKVADYCLDKGLERIQYSCFLGEMSRTLARELASKCKRKLGDKPGKIRLVPVCEKDLASQVRIENVP
ncbi:CRISPR-associated endonuclease Cas2 [Fimbriimonadia bacterium ATM]|nr:MAG: CRISPR-associated endonuclease Cas2 [Armatimonadota bacterium]MBC6969092.1 CRISPR-associated endonuclease Cas2 [Armatimonadota bacterium]MCE7900465.1 CRISPR-associated endonuclease Cas2 [Armatimonadetes bacterium ATM1]MDL1928356.1 CRISPR-associated endonuclease Cas2 [Fimbriimonadia bacterium ATM]RIJ94703.1 MAG: CRISPR-associated endonuclease Cas2 [Armatimonadota bacterium]